MLVLMYTGGIACRAPPSYPISCLFLCALNIDLLLGLFRFCELHVRMFTRYAGCYPMQDFAGMSPAEKNDWEHVYVLQFSD